MTKERFVSEIDKYSNTGDFYDWFISQNVVIPKGTNRHPDADAVHAWVEDVSAPLQYERNGMWFTGYPFGIDTRYRIKPPEPVYEWQWLAVPYDIVNLETSISIYMTDIEAKECNKHSVGLFTPIKIEETKRIRQ